MKKAPIPLSRWTCGIRMVMKDVRDAMADIFENTTFADVFSGLPGSSIGKRDTWTS